MSGVITTFSPPENTSLPLLALSQHHNFYTRNPIVVFDAILCTPFCRHNAHLVAKKQGDVVMAAFYYKGRTLPTSKAEDLIIKASRRRGDNSAPGIVIVVLAESAEEG